MAAEWSEHCSYKSSKKHLRMLPTIGPNVIVEKGYDSGVLDVGDGYVVTVHIESHNHPSAVEPFGGAATGVGGVIRDILSAGTRPIALFDGLRFGDIKDDVCKQDGCSKMQLQELQIMETVSEFLLLVEKLSLINVIKIMH